MGADDFVYPKGLCQGAARAVFHHAKHEEEFHSEQEDAATFFLSERGNTVTSPGIHPNDPSH